jgi:FtsP/CotA-like multicopper oxidase with cupredoxin domain
VATTRSRVLGDAPGRAFVLQDGAAPPAPDSVRFPGSALVPRRGEPTAITVVNRAGAPLAVHWHGMELESWFDGVGGWSGSGRSVRPPIAPGDSFVVRITPPRAGTFIYHTHDEAGSALASGLYGALLVEEPAAPRDTTRDHVVVLGMLGDGGAARLAVNGRHDPEPLRLAPGVHRLRLVSIPVDDRLDIELVRDSALQTWRPVAADGAGLPEHQRAERPARVRLSAGQTLDAEVRLEPGALAAGAYALRVRTLYYPTDPRRPTLTVLPLRAWD